MSDYNPPLAFLAEDLRMSKRQRMPIKAVELHE